MWTSETIFHGVAYEWTNDLQLAPSQCISPIQMDYKLGAHMARKKMKEKDKQQFQNVGLLKEDHDLLRKLADSEQRSMARQLSVLIRKAVADTEPA